MNNLLSETIQIALVLGFMGFLAWLWSRRGHQQVELQRLHLEGRNRLLETMESPQALLEFAASEVGQKLLEPPSHPKESAVAPHPEGLRLIQTGLVSLFLGFGFRSTYYVAMNWPAANLKFNEVAAVEAFRKALGLWQWSQAFEWAGLALIVCGLLAAVLARLSRTSRAKS